jgi:hypothetical protein
VDGVLPYDWSLVVHDQEGTHRVRDLSLAPGQTVEDYLGASSNGQIARQELSAAVRLVAVVVAPVSIAPVPIAPVPIAPIVRVCIHDARLGNHDRRPGHNHGRWLHDHRCGPHNYRPRSDYNRRWWGDNCDWQRQPKPNGNMYPSRVCRERQGQAGDSDASRKKP